MISTAQTKYFWESYVDSKLCTQKTEKHEFLLENEHLYIMNVIFFKITVNITCEQKQI